MSDLSVAESKCQNCGGPNFAWWTDSDPLEERFVDMGGRGVILCAMCFVRLWEDHNGLEAVWHLVPKGIRAAGLSTSGPPHCTCTPIPGGIDLNPACITHGISFDTGGDE